MATLSLDRSARRPSAAIGVAAALGSVAIWAGWIVGTRHAVTHALDPETVGLLRFGVPALVFLPVLLRTGLMPRAIGPITLVSLMGAGAPFFITVAYAMAQAPAADIGPLLPGTMPLFVALIAVLVFGEPLGRWRGLGLALVAAGIFAIGGRGVFAADDIWRGHGLLLAGALMWAIYTHAFKRSGLSALEAAAIVAAWSTIMLIPVGVPSLLRALEHGLARDVIVQGVVQGLLSGVIAIVLYGVAVTRLGAARASVYVALVPPLAMLIAIPVLGEWPDTAAMIGIAATAVGVALAARAPDPQRGRVRGG